MRVQKIIGTQRDHKVDPVISQEYDLLLLSSIQDGKIMVAQNGNYKC